MADFFYVLETWFTALLETGFAGQSVRWQNLADVNKGFSSEESLDAGAEEV